MIKRAQTPPVPLKKAPRPQLLAGLLLFTILALGAVYVGIAPQTLSVAARKRELPIYSVAREDNVIAISFDASWGGDKTLSILDTLDKYNVKTTFFLVDLWTQKYPELVKEIAARGHEIGNHSTTHPHMSELSEEKIIKELREMSDHVEALTGVRPTLFRPPFGDYNDRVILVSRAQGYEAVQWSVDSLDWKNRGKEDLIRRATRVQSGDIVLFHNDAEYTYQALPEILEYYQKNGFRVVPVSEILLTGPTRIDVQGRMHPIATTQPEV